MLHALPRGPSGIRCADFKVKNTNNQPNNQETVKQKYGEAAKRTAGGGTACCGGGASIDGCDPITKDLYSEAEKGALPEKAVAASLGCGNPTALAQLQPGETVLDLGSGGGIDVILSAKRVGPSGLAYGLDMTDEMLALARRNANEAGSNNTIFLKGYIEEVPLPADSVDVVISNCVINLSTDKAAVLLEIARVLRPGGRVGLSDVVAEDHLTEVDQAERGSYLGCIAGALSKSEYIAGLEEAGFEQVDVTFTHRVADGLHAPIVKAVKTEAPGKKGLPMIQPASKAGCC